MPPHHAELRRETSTGGVLDRREYKAILGSSLSPDLATATAPSTELPTHGFAASSRTYGELPSRALASNSVASGSKLDIKEAEVTTDIPYTGAPSSSYPSSLSSVTALPSLATPDLLARADFTSSYTERPLPSIISLYTTGAPDLQPTGVDAQPQSSDGSGVMGMAVISSVAVNAASARVANSWTGALLGAGVAAAVVLGAV